MRRRGLWLVAPLLELVALGVPDLARAEMKLAILKVKGWCARPDPSPSPQPWRGCRE